MNTVDLQFLVGDSAKTFVDEEKQQSYTVEQPDNRSMSWKVVTKNNTHNWQITKVVFADPTRHALLMQVTFNALNGKTVSDFNLYLLHNPAMDNSGAKDTAAIQGTGGRSFLVASDGTRASALTTSRSWKAIAGKKMLSVGFVGVNDGYTDLLGGTPDRTMSFTFDEAKNGNVAEMGWIDFGTSTSKTISFDVVLGFGATTLDAMATANASLGESLAALKARYDAEWNDYANGLSTQGGLADDQYYLAAMSLKSIQDKSNGAMIAGMGTPWGETNGDSNQGGYHLVWARDLFKFANALITAGDIKSGKAAVDYLFKIQQQTSDCGITEYNASGCPQGYSRKGRFPQNSWVSGWQYWQGTQLDEQAMPILLAYRLGATTYTPLWPKIRSAADYIIETGPWTYQERWEENSGYSPSSIAAAIAGLVAASKVAAEMGEPTEAAKYMAAADYWQQNVTTWTFTSKGTLGDGKYFLRLNPAARNDIGAGPEIFDPKSGPDAAVGYTIGNGGGYRDQRSVVDGGFLELVRMGVKGANDAEILGTLPEYDSTLKQTVAGKGDGWFRYVFDGYGELNDGKNYDGTNGRGRLWPIFTAERGMYEIAKSEKGSAGLNYLAAIKAFSTPEGFIPEQVWNNSATLAGGWVTTSPSGYAPGTPTKSIAPLSWAMGEYINLLASIAADRVVDIPPMVCGRYFKCDVPPTDDEVEVPIAATAITFPGEWLYVTGDTEELGDWNTDLGIPLDPTGYPTWQNKVNLPASTIIQYKYYRKNADGSVTWENITGGGNRVLITPASGSTELDDRVAW